MKTVLTWTLLVTGVCAVPAATGNQVLLRYLDPADGTPLLLAANRAGRLFVISSIAAASGQRLSRVVELDLDGSRVASLDVAQVASPTAVAMDGQGSLIVAGLDAKFQGIVVKLDPQLQNTLFSRSLAANIGAVAADGSGNIYLTGSTSSASFVVTAGAYQTSPPTGNPFGTAAYAFLTEISPSNQLLYSTYFGDAATTCIGGSACLGAFGVTSGTAIAVGPNGAISIAGSTSAYKLPTTPGALAQVCGCGYRQPTGFIARFQPSAAQQLQWSTFVNANTQPYSTSVMVNSLDLDAAGNVLVGGSAASGLPTTAGALQPSVTTVTGTADSGGFLMQVNATGTAVVWGTYFGGSALSRVKTLRWDAQGQVLFTGVTVNQVQPEPVNTPVPRAYVARLTSDGTRLIDFYEGPVGQDLAIASTGGFAALGQSLWIETTNTGPSLLAVTNSAGGAFSSAVARCELVTLYGAGLGPATPLNGQVLNGAFTTSLGGYKVLFSGVAAPLIYADSGQINAVVPRGVGTVAHIQVVTPATTIDGPTLPVPYSAVPGIFEDSKTGMAAALNQDGSVNSLSNPARPGSIVTVFATGGGANYIDDGALVPMGIYPATTTVWAGGQFSLEVVFAGDAPGLVAGVMQINLRVPDSPPPRGTLGFSLVIGGVETGQTEIAVAQ